MTTHTSTTADSSDSEATPSWVSERFFATLRRLYSGRVSDCIGELLQNSQRADATHVTMAFHAVGQQPITSPSGLQTTEPIYDSFVYRDDGCGLQGGIEGVRTLLRLGDSAYDPEVMANQAPMGMGFYALLALEGITQVVIESNDVRFTLEPERWWSSTAYRDAWLEQFRSTHTSATVAYRPGFQVTVSGKPAVIRDFRREAAGVTTSTGAILNRSAAFGYEGIFDLTVDDMPVDLSVPSDIALPRAEIVAMYQNNQCRIDLTRADQGTRTGQFAVNWYGQIIQTLALAGTGVQVYLEVRKGQPVTPQAPVRAGLIKDGKLDAFLAWVRDQVFAYLLDPAHPERACQVASLQILAALDRERYVRESPYLVLEPYRRLGRSRYEVRAADDLLRWGESEVVARGEVGSKLFLGSAAVTVYFPYSGADRQAMWFHKGLLERSPDEVAATGVTHCGREYPEGIGSFLHALGLRAYAAGPVSRHFGLTEKYLVWIPGTVGDSLHTPARGHWALTKNPDVLPDEKDWLPLPPTAEVYVVSETSSAEIADTDLFVATDDIVRFLLGAGCVARCEADEDDDERYGWFRESIAHLIAEHYDRDVLYRGYTFWDLRKALPEDGGKLAGIDFLTARDQEIPPGVDDFAAVQYVRLRGTTGVTRTLRLIGDAD